MSITVLRVILLADPLGIASRAQADDQVWFEGVVEGSGKLSCKVENRDRLPFRAEKIVYELSLNQGDGPKETVLNRPCIRECGVIAFG